MGLGDHLDDADDRLAEVGMVEEAPVPDLHLAHQVAGLMAADTVPFLARVSLRDEVVPGKHIRLGLEKPAGHPMALRQAMTSTESNTSAAA